MSLRPIVIATRRQRRPNEKEVDFFFAGPDGPKHKGKLILKGGDSARVILRTDDPVELETKGGDVDMNRRSR